MVTDDVNKYIELTEGFFGFLKEFRLSRAVQNNQISRYQLEIILKSVEGKTSRDLHLKFYDVIGLKVEGIERQSMMWFEITDVRDFYLEDILYEVNEIKEHGLSFSCRAFSAHKTGG
jgi:hypothetical protein